MLKIRLARVGRKHDPSYRVIVTEKGRGPQTGAYHEKLGTYDARSDEYDLKDERIEYWLSEGAQPSDTVHNLFVKVGIIDDDTVNPLPNKSPVSQDEGGEEEEADQEQGGDETQSKEDDEEQKEAEDDESDEMPEEDGENSEDEDTSDNESENDTDPESAEDDTDQEEGEEEDGESYESDESEE